MFPSSERLNHHTRPTHHTQLMAVVKADAYGHGVGLVASELKNAGIGFFATATVAEAISIRKAGISDPILVFAPVIDVDEADEAVRENLVLTIGDYSHLETLRVAAHVTGRRSVVHLNVDTGMSRIGANSDSALKLALETADHPTIKLEGVYSHFAMAEEQNQESVSLQMDRFHHVCRELQQIPGHNTLARHIANTAATLGNPETHLDFVRVGLGLYGIHPAQHLVDTVELDPVMSVRAKILQVKTIPAGEGISYGHSFVATTQMKIAVVAIGYADGVPRHLSNQMDVLINGTPCRQVGRITMDQLMVDVTHLPDVTSGDVVTLIGRDQDRSIHINDWAHRLRTVPYELLCGFRGRLPRLMRDGPQTDGVASGKTWKTTPPTRSRWSLRKVDSN